ncbi:radical SAM protein [Acidobacteria bacterium AH-259-L09]|nr:radical SAM protein [Acidobacteria bacterium AH-259-L09]
MKQEALFDLAPDTPSALREKNGVQHFELSCKSILNYCDTYRMPDTFTINPYRGCEFGCSYCYARYTHEFMDLEWDEFEKKIFVKSRAADVLLRTLDHKRVAGRHIAMGTATDPYQPAEAKFHLTRKILNVFAQTEGLSLSITTKSSLVKRDINLFQKIAEKNDFQVNISLSSLDANLLANLEPKASRPQARLTALREITAAGVRAGIFIMPILPGITDSRETLESVVRAARQNGAHYVSSNVLFLRESAKTIFYSFLRQNHPDLYRKYHQIYGARSYAPGRYRDKMRSLVNTLKKKYGFGERSRSQTKTRVPQQPLLS